MPASRLARQALSRRDLAKLLPVLAAAPALAQQRRGQDNTPQRVSKDQLKAGLALLGLEFKDAELDMALPGVNRQLANYEALRKIDIPLDTAPAIAFSTTLPGHPVPKGTSKFKQTAPAVANLSLKPDELPFSSAIELGALIKAGKITPTELTKLYLERLKTYSPRLLNVITLTEDLALDQAAKASAEIRAGKYKGPLHGVPYGAKDLFDTKGFKTTWGAEPYQDRVATYDATVIEKLRDAGAILVAKLSMGALAQGGLWFNGMTKTPWNYERTSSGSSAGSASATAAGLVGFSIGTETLGSIISPATACGVAGARPTYGRVSRYGAMALSWTMDKPGPICRSIADCAEVLRAISGPDGKDLTVVDAPLNFDAGAPLSSMKIGYIEAEFNRGGDAQKKLYQAALDVLRKQGATLEPMVLPDYPYQQIRLVLTAEAAAAFDDLTRDHGIDKLKGQDPFDWPNSFRTARTIPAVEYIRAQRARTIFMRKYAETMGQWDAYVTPTGSGSLTATNLTGHPQCVVPCGFIEGLPQGLLFTGRLWEEGTPIRVAYAYEQATEWHKTRPTLQT